MGVNLSEFTKFIDNYNTLVDNVNKGIKEGKAAALDASTLMVESTELEKSAYHLEVNEQYKLTPLLVQSLREAYSIMKAHNRLHSIIELNRDTYYALAEIEYNTLKEQLKEEKNFVSKGITYGNLS